MKVKTLQLGPVKTNTYLVYDEDTLDAVVIDPSKDDKDVTQHEIEKRGLKVHAILVTHCHFDHIANVDALKEQLNVPVYASEIEASNMLDGDKNLSYMFAGFLITATADNIIAEGDELSFGTLKFRCIEVPGHSEQSICYYAYQDNMLFSGDTLFRGTIGRTDLYAGAPYTLQEMIQTKLFLLPDETVVYPGHGFATTIENEKYEREVYFED